MIIALAATLFVGEFRPDFINALGIGVGVLLGAVLGAFSAQKVPMTGMPQMVATFNGLGGGAIALVAVSEFYQGRATSGVGLITALFTVIIGSISFMGSIVAVSKLQEFLLSGSVTFPGQQVVNAIIFLGILALCANVLAGGAIARAVGLSSFLTPFVSIVILLVASLVLGFLFVIPIGGADMPLVISLLNAFPGLAVAVGGFELENNVLIVSGMLVGASGTLLTLLMGRAMNRSIANVLFGAFGQIVAGPAAAAETNGGTVRSASADDVAVMLAYASKVVFVPGYGMAVAQAQHDVRALADELESRGVDVSYAIHPVAGRMPGHLNVLLAEANVPYPQLKEMDEANPEFSRTDVAVIVGANDVVNPDARNNQGSPIYGMPILNVDQANAVVVLKRSMNPGFAGIENPLFYNPKTVMLFGDAKDSITHLIADVKGL